MCPPDQNVTRVPGVDDAKRSAATWIARLPPGEADRVLLDAGAIRALNARYAALADGPVDPLEPRVASAAAVKEQIAAAFAHVESSRRDGKIVIDDASLAEARARSDRLSPTDELRVLRAEAALWCIPTLTPVLAPGGSVAYDRNRCSEAHAGELVRVLGRTGDGWALVHAGYAVGWMAGEAALGARLGEAEARRHRDGGLRAVVTRDRTDAGGAPVLRLGTSFPLESRASGPVVRIPAEDGLREVPLGGRLERGPLPLTRRAVLSLAFEHLGDPYGWGGYEGGLDCSRFLHDLLAVFGLSLPRNSSVQALAGTRVIELSGLPAAARAAALREANACGIVLAQMPGHIMLYLGEDGDVSSGAGFHVISALGDLRHACPGGGETLLHVDRVEVSTLGAGEGTSKGPMLMRLARLSVIGACP
jgi:hypothetical protein